MLPYSQNKLKSIGWDTQIHINDNNISKGQSAFKRGIGKPIYSKHKAELNIPSVQRMLLSHTRVNNDNDFVTAYKSKTIKYYDFIDQL